MYQKENPTGVSVPKVTKGSNHDGSEKNKIMSNKEAMNEEIASIRYLIEYMNNNKKNKI
jgi:hypothetical protein